MKPWLTMAACYVVAAVCFGSVAIMGGCTAQKDRHALNTTIDFFTITSDALVDYRDAGEINDEEWEDLSRIRANARVMLDAWKGELESALYGPDSYNNWRAGFNRELSKLISFRVQVETQHE